MSCEGSEDIPKVRNSKPQGEVLGFNPQIDLVSSWSRSGDQDDAGGGLDRCVTVGPRSVAELAVAIQAQSVPCDLRNLLDLVAVLHASEVAAGIELIEDGSQASALGVGLACE